MGTNLIHGVVVRKTNKYDNSYAVWPTDGPGVIEVQCFVVHVHESMCHLLDSMDSSTFSNGKGLPVSVTLGPFCLTSAKFLNCEMRCPSSYEPCLEENSTDTQKRALEIPKNEKDTKKRALEEDTAVPVQHVTKTRRRWGQWT